MFVCERDSAVFVCERETELRGKLSASVFKHTQTYTHTHTERKQLTQQEYECSLQWSSLKFGRVLYITFI